MALSAQDQAYGQQIYDSCLNAGGTQSHCIASAQANYPGWQPSGGGGGWGNVDYSDPNYWSGWNQTFGSLGAALGQWVNAFDGNQNNYYPYPPQQQQNNTMLWIVGAIVLVLVIVIIVLLTRKK